MGIIKKIQTDSDTPFSDEQTDERIHQLLTDPNDEVTEEDIRNVRTDIGTKSATPPASSTPLPDNTGKAAENLEPGDPNDPGIETPWNIIK
ncbi:hypothetical protein [Ferruginibacter sp. HRS2-29]|uniref:hypothetical protein n=1 Tax=Ferruginibacter sp. HRS2-29 TaxID=2487334 RepID=UPI0020CBDB8E|nr:hypothetical protein [Ferruginibacter sp. HRS2-29]